MKSKDKVLAALGEHPEWSTAALAAFLKMSRSGIERLLRSLQATGQLRRVGSRKSGHWEPVVLPPPATRPAGTVVPALPDEAAWMPAVPQEIEAKLEQVMGAVDATYQAYLAAWGRQDPDAEQLRQRQHQLGRIASRLQAARLQQLGAGLGKQSVQFKTANAKLEQSVVRLQETVRRSGRVVEIAARIDQILDLAVKAAK